MALETEIVTDVLVIGGGYAGCFAAIKAKEQGVDVTLVDRGHIGKSGESPWATNTVVFNPEWGHDLAAWMNQVNFLSEYVNDPEWTEITFKDSYARFQDRLSWGEEYYKDDKGEWMFVTGMPSDTPGKFPITCILGPRRQRVDAERAHAAKIGVRIMDRVMVHELLKQDGAVVGAIGRPVESYDVYIFKAKATVLATGTATLKPWGGNPTSAMTGDGEAMGYRVGAEISGKEWIHGRMVSAEFPASFSVHLFTDSRTLHRSGTTEHRSQKVMYNAEGNLYTFPTGGYHDIFDVFEVDAGRAPLFAESSRFKTDWRGIPEGTPRQPIDLEAERLGRRRQVEAGGLGAAGHVSEGIRPINTKCATSVPGLYAAGDCCDARQAGPRYPSMGFATLSVSVTGARAGLGAAEYASQMKKKPTVDSRELERLKWIIYAPMERKGGFSPAWTTQVLRDTMFPYWVLLLKHEDRLKAALTLVEFLRDRIAPKLTARDPHELRLAQETKYMILNAEMKLRASLFRTESRATHLREDYPRRDDPNWLAWVKIKEEDGEMKLYKEPIPKKWWPDLSLPYEEKYPVRFPGE